MHDRSRLHGERVRARAPACPAQVLCWLSILAHHNTATPLGSLVGVGDIVREHWRTYGRNYYSRYDYETVDAAKANLVFERLRGMATLFAQGGHGPSAPLTLAGRFELVMRTESLCTLLGMLVCICVGECLSMHTRRCVCVHTWSGGMRAGDVPRFAHPSTHLRPPPTSLSSGPPVPPAALGDVCR